MQETDTFIQSSAGARPATGVPRLARPRRRRATVVESTDEAIAELVMLGGLLVLVVIWWKTRGRIVRDVGKRF